MSTPLMPKATAVWLVDNTTLTFDQVAKFCGLHPLEVQGIADGEVAAHIVGLDPIANGQLTWDEIERCQKDYKAELKIQESNLPKPKTRKGPRYTPVSRRQDRPDAIAWLVRNHPEMSDAQISRLVGTTKPTIQSIRERTHWNSANLKPTDPVTLGLCSQIELDAAIEKGAKRNPDAVIAKPLTDEEVAPQVEEAVDPFAAMQSEAEPDNPRAAKNAAEALFGGGSNKDD